MLIDWPTVGFQVVNFLLLVYLLKRFLYGPITRAMRQREEELAAIRAEAERARSEARLALESWRDRERQSDETLAERRRRVEAETDQRRRELLAQARGEAEAQRQSWRQALENERQTFLDELKRRAAAGVLNVSRQALAELAGEELETALVRVMIGKLEALPAEEKVRFIAAARTGILHLRSGFEPDGDLRRQLVEALRQNYAVSATFDWRYDPDLPLELEIAADGLRLNWGVASYLTELQQSVAALFGHPAGVVDQGPPPEEQETR